MWEHVRGLGGDHLYVGACWGGACSSPPRLDQGRAAGNLEADVLVGLCCDR